MGETQPLPADSSQCDGGGTVHEIQTEGREDLPQGAPRLMGERESLDIAE